MVLMVFRELVTLEVSQFRRTEVEVRLGRVKNRKAVSKDEVTGEMIKARCDMVVDWTWRLCYMAFEGGLLPKE